jgi:hypothetical protein
LRHEGELDVELIKLARRAVCASVLVAEAGGDLEVAVEARHHVELLEHLRRLRQSKELARIDAARDEVVARAFGRARRQDRRLQLEEAGFDHASPHRCDDRAAPYDVVVHALAPKIEVAVGEALLFGRLLIDGDREGQGIAARQHLDLADPHLDFTRREVRVHVARVASRDPASDANDALTLERLELRKARRVLLGHQLRQPEMVAEIHE